MCGIAGRILNSPGKVGADLVDLMDAQEHRGADSTGFAIYGPVRDTGYVLRGMGLTRPIWITISKTLNRFYTIMGRIFYLIQTY